MKPFKNIDDQKILELSKFVLKMFLAGVIFQLIIYLDPDTYILQELLAEFTRQALSFAGIDLTRQGILLYGETNAYIVVQDCLGWKSKSLFVALVFASSSNILKHFKIILLGLAILLVSNIIRVLTTVYLSEIGIISFDIIHGILWRWGLSLVVIIIWFYWFRNMNT